MQQQFFPFVGVRKSQFKLKITIAQNKEGERDGGKLDYEGSAKF